MYFYFYFFQISFHLLFHSFFFFYPSHSWQGPLDNYGCHENIIINSFLYRKKLLGHIRNPHIPCKHTHTHTEIFGGMQGTDTHTETHTEEQGYVAFFSEASHRKAACFEWMLLHNFFCVFRAVHCSGAKK